jgi:uncharacterized protein (TIGR02452 family)
LRDQRDRFYPIARRSCLLSEGVTVFRSGEADGYQFIQAVKISVISCAAQAKPRLDERGGYEEGRDKAGMLKQIEVILEAATVAGCQALVLSAFGCGAYGRRRTALPRGHT